MTQVERDVFLVRHGHTLLNEAGLLDGHLDPTLDQVGLTQADELGKALASRQPAHIVSSPLRRAIQTAQLLAERVHRPVEIDRRLIDRDFGPWAGQSPSDVIQRYGSIDNAPDVETRESVTARAFAVLDEQLGRLRYGPIVLVTHQVVNQLLLHALAPKLGEPDNIRQRTGCWNLIVRYEHRWRVHDLDQRP